MPDRLSLFRASSQAAPDGGQLQHRPQQPHQNQQQQQQEQLREPAATTLGALPTAATPKCWAVVQTPLETLYDAEEEECEDSGYFSQLGTTAITPIYSKPERCSTATAAEATAGSAAAGGNESLPADEGGAATARAAGGEAGGGARGGVATGLGASPIRQYTLSEPHGFTWHFPGRSSASQRTVTTREAATAGPGECGRAGGPSCLHPGDAAVVTGAGGSGSGTSSRLPLLRLKTSASVPNIHSHFKTRALLRRPRSRNTSKEDGLQRETAFWGGDLFSGANVEEQEVQATSSTSSDKLGLRKESEDSAARPSIAALPCINSGASSGSSCRGLTSPLMALLFSGAEDASSGRAHSCEEGEAGGSAFLSSRITSAGAAASVGTASSSSTQQQPLLTPRSQQQELRDGSSQQQEIPAVLCPHAVSKAVPLYCHVGGSQSTGHIGGMPATDEHSASKEVHRGVPLLRRSLFHPFRKHVTVSGCAQGGSCPDFRATHNTFGSSPSPAGSLTSGQDSQRNSSRQHLLQCPAAKAGAPGRSSGGGLPPLPYRQRHSKSGGDVSAAAASTATAAAGALLPDAATQLTRDRSDPGKPATGGRLSAGAGAVADLSGSSSFPDAASKSTASMEASVATVPPGGAATTEAAGAGAPHCSAAATAGEKTEPSAQHKSLMLFHQPPRAALYTKPRNNPAAAGAAAAAAMHAAGFAATASGAGSASTLSTLSSPVGVPDLGGYAAGVGRLGEAAFSGASSGVGPPTERGAAGERGCSTVSVCGSTSVAVAPAAAEDSASAAVGDSHLSSDSSGALVDGGGAAGPAAPHAAAVAAGVSSGAADGRSGCPVGSKAIAGVGEMHRSSSLSTLSKKLSIRALKLRGGSGGNGSSAGAVPSPAATLASTPASAASSSHSIVSQAVDHGEESGVAAAECVTRCGVPRQQQQQLHPHHQQLLQQQRPEDAEHSAVSALHTLRLSPVPVVPEEDTSQISKGSST